MSVEFLTAVYFLGLLVFIFAGLPIAFVLGGLPVIFIYFTWGPQAFYMVVAQTWGSMNSFSLLALPLYIFMAMILERSGVATDLYDMMYLWFGSLRGGLAIGTLVICAISLMRWMAPISMPRPSFRRSRRARQHSRRFRTDRQGECLPCGRVRATGYPPRDPGAVQEGPSPPCQGPGSGDLHARDAGLLPKVAGHGRPTGQRAR